MKQPRSVMINEDTQINLDKVTRLEVIGPEGREIVKYGIKLECQVQDEGRTLKIFYDLTPRLNNVNNPLVNN